MSLSGYEELANDGDTTAAEESTAMRDETTADYTAQHDDDASQLTAKTGAEHSTFHEDHGDIEDSLLDDGDVTGSTPRPPRSKTIKPQFSNLESPYETMKHEMEGEENNTTVLHDDDEDSTVLFAQRTAQLPDMSMASRYSLGEEQTGEQSVRRNKDPLLHRILDKNYRIQTTPHKPALRISPLKKVEGGKETQSWKDSPPSSPEMAVPTLRSEAFMSPYKSNARQRLQAATQGPRTPGVSVQTPGTARKTRDAFATEDSVKQEGDSKYEIDWDSDDDGDVDLYAGMSPPKTIQFALPPSKLLQTPGKLPKRGTDCFTVLILLQRERLAGESSTTFF